VARERPVCQVCWGIGEGHSWITQHFNPSWLADVPRGSGIWPESIRLQRVPVFVGAGAGTEPVPGSQQKQIRVPVSPDPVILSTCVVLRRIQGHRLHEGDCFDAKTAPVSGY